MRDFKFIRLDKIISKWLNNNHIYSYRIIIILPSRSSDSSGYLSREGGRGSRVGSAGPTQSRSPSTSSQLAFLMESSNNMTINLIIIQTRTSTAPLRKLVHTASSSSLKNQSSRSSSSLTSRSHHNFHQDDKDNHVGDREAEFQAWKRRKDYDPLAAARWKSL